VTPQETFSLRDFHTHTTLSDGVLTPIELIRRAHVNGYAAIGVSDHCAQGTLARVIAEVAGDCALAERHWGIKALVGVELTHAPAEAIAELAAEAKSLGAAYVVVHGETPVEPVVPGTNLAAASSPAVDLLAHPGLMDEETAAAAAENGVFLEITARGGHCLGNGHVLRLALEAGAKVLLSSDAHAPGDLLTPTMALKVVRGAGLTEQEARAVLENNSREFLQRCLAQRAALS